MDRQELKANYEALKYVVGLINELNPCERAASGLYSLGRWPEVMAALEVARIEAERVDPLAVFTTRAGRSYVLNGYGELCQEQYYQGPESFSGQWRLIGGRSTWNAQVIKVDVVELIADPERLKGLWIVDYDHGSRRFWQGDGAVKSVRVLRGPGCLANVAAKLAGGGAL